MISVDKLASAIYGLWLLYKFDVRAWNHFDKSTRGFWSAYVVAAVLAPIQLTHAVLQYDPETTKLALIPFVIVQALSYVITWTLFPFVMLYISNMLGRGTRYLWHLVPYIWLQFPLALLLYTVQLFADIGILPSDILVLLTPMVLIASVVYGTFVAGIGLQVATSTALGLVVLDFVLGLLVGGLIDQVYIAPKKDDAVIERVVIETKKPSTSD
jgi:hypothetical protein